MGPYSFFSSNLTKRYQVLVSFFFFFYIFSLSFYLVTCSISFFPFFLYDFTFLSSYLVTFSISCHLVLSPFLFFLSFFPSLFLSSCFLFLSFTSSLDAALVLACDGLFDVCTDQEVCDLILRGLLAFF